MIGSRLLATHRSGALETQARALFDGGLAVAAGEPVTDDDLPQAALSLALQACVETMRGDEVSNFGVVAGSATAYAAWASKVADTTDELEDALAAFVASYRKIAPTLFAARRA